MNPVMGCLLQNLLGRPEQDVSGRRGRCGYTVVLGRSSPPINLVQSFLAGDSPADIALAQAKGVPAFGLGFEALGGYARHISA